MEKICYKHSIVENYNHNNDDNDDDDDYEQKCSTNKLTNMRKWP